MNLVGFLLKPELDSVVCILGDWVGGGGVVVNDVTIYLKEVIITLI